MKKLISLLLTLAMLLSGVSAFAADASGTAVYYMDNIYVEGNFAVCWNADGKRTFPLSYDNSVYIPLRTAAEWMGKDAAVSPDGKTFSLSGNHEPLYRGDAEEDIYDSLGKEERKAKLSQPVSVSVLNGAKLLLDGNTVALTDSEGKAVPMIAWDNEPYLPVRPLAEMMKMELAYAKRTTQGGTIFLRTPVTDEQLKACRAYIASLNTALPRFTALFGQDQKMGEYLDHMDTAHKAVEECLALARSFKNTPKPDCTLLDALYKELQTEADQVIAGCNRASQLINNGADLKEIQYVMYNNWTGEGYDTASAQTARTKGQGTTEARQKNGAVRICRALAGIPSAASAVVNQTA